MAAILDFQRPLMSDIVHSGTIGTPDPEKVVFAFGILLVSGTYGLGCRHLVFPTSTYVVSLTSDFVHSVTF